MPAQAQWSAPIRYRVNEAAKARGKTLTEYLTGGPVRLQHIHEELAFDQLQAMVEGTTTEVVLKEGEKENGSKTYSRNR